MSVELVGLAYDRDLTDRVWAEITVREACDLVLEDEFRRKVDPRSLLYHKGQIELLGQLELCLKQGGESFTLVEFIARRFAAGVEEFPGSISELAFDFLLIRHFSSLAMVDDFLLADSFLRELLRKAGFLDDGAPWSLPEVRDFEGVAAALRDVRMQDILEAGRGVEKGGSQVSFENLVRNYIEFLSYASNNRLVPFFYNSQTEFRRWGDLAERKNQRNERVVDLSLKPSARRRPGKAPAALRKETRKDLRERLRQRRERDALLAGLSDPDPLIRQKAAESLCLLGAAEVVAQLVEALEDREPEVRQEIARVLGTVEDDRATRALLKVARKDEVESVRLTAAYMLRRRGVREVIPLLLDAVAAGKAHFAAILAYHPAFRRDVSAAERLSAMGSAHDPGVRRDAAFLLGRLGSAGAVKALKSLLGDGDEWTRCNALYSLWEAAPEEAAAPAAEMAAASSEAAARAGAIVRGWTETAR